MAKKTYRTFSLKSLDIHTYDAKGNKVEAIFRGGIQIDSTAKFITDDPAVQKALEKCSGFGRDYYIESVEETEKPVVEPAPIESAPEEKPQEELPAEFKDSQRFRNLVEMVNAIRGLGIDLPADANYMQAKAAARKEGYDFQIQR